MYYTAEIQDTDGTRDSKGTAAAVAARLTRWQGREGRSVAVYRVDGEDWTLVDRRTTRSAGTVPAGYQSGVQRDAVWDTAV